MSMSQNSNTSQQRPEYCSFAANSTSNNIFKMEKLEYQSIDTRSENLKIKDNKMGYRRSASRFRTTKKVLRKTYSTKTQHNLSLNDPDYRPNIKYELETIKYDKHGNSKSRMQTFDKKPVSFDKLNSSMKFLGSLKSECSEKKFSQCSEPAFLGTYGSDQMRKLMNTKTFDGGSQFL